MDKRYTIILLLTLFAIVIIGVMMFMFFSKSQILPAEPAEPLKFQFIEIKETGMSAIQEVLGVKKTDDGVVIYQGYKNMSDDTMVITREVNGDKALLEEIENTLGNYRVQKWNGFDGPNPPDVYDGTMFSFKCKMTDGSVFYAHGSNNYPKNYHNVYRYLEDIVQKSVVNDKTFETKVCTVQLPESWIGEVEVKYDEDYVCFQLPLESGNLSLFRIDFRTWESDDEANLHKIGKIKSVDTGEELLLEIYQFNNFMKETDGTEKQYQIYNSIDNTIENVISSLELLDSYYFIAESE